MSRHRLVRNLDTNDYLDEDDYDDCDEDEYNADDDPDMRKALGLIKKKLEDTLGDAAEQIPCQAREDALWHYFYDVEKSAAYLVNRLLGPWPEVKKEKKKGGSHVPLSPHFFDDTPWGRTPEYRHAFFIEPTRTRGGLMGGSGKMSKLQQLAAAKKKKIDDKKNLSNNAEQTRSKPCEISVQQKACDEPKERSGNAISGQGLGTLKRHKCWNEEVRRPVAAANNEPKSATPEYLPRQLLEGDASTAVHKRSTDKMQETYSVDKAVPSAFASALFGPIAENPKRVVMESYALSYMNLHPSLEFFTQPSPDEVVMEAQSKADTAMKNTKAGKEKREEKLANGVQKLTLKTEEARLPKSKNLNVLSEFEKSKSLSKKEASFVVIGHVDAGKSTMMGRLLVDLNVVDQRTIGKLKKEAARIGKSSFALAWVLDQRTEERSRGVTIDIATNRFETKTMAFTILDAPGHRDFIPNMIAGASQADFAVLVIDATLGAFEAGLKGQTKEHSLLIRSMGVSRLIIAINKLDIVGWSEDRFNKIKDQVMGFLTAKSLGFRAQNLAFVPVAGLHGDNLVCKSTDPAAAWYKGPTLVEELEKSEPNARALEKPLRMSISEVYRSINDPLIVSGRIDAGSLQVGDAVLIQPCGEKAYINSLDLDNEPTEWAVAGQNAVLHLSHMNKTHVHVGDIICDVALPIQCLESFSIKALAFEFLMPMQVDVHRGSFHTAGRIELMCATLDKVTGATLQNRPRIVKPGSVARLTVRLESKAPLEAGQRVVLRSEGNTVAAGLLE